MRGKARGLVLSGGDKAHLRWDWGETIWGERGTDNTRIEKGAKNDNPRHWHLQWLAAVPAVEEAAAPAAAGAVVLPAPAAPAQVRR